MGVKEENDVIIFVFQKESFGLFFGYVSFNGMCYCFEING